MVNRTYFVKSTPLELLLYPFDIMQVYYRHNKYVHEEGNMLKK